MPFPVDIKYIIETEQELGLVFPDSFKSKMTKENVRKSNDRGR